jgi:hypothetical protein
MKTLLFLAAFLAAPAHAADGFVVKVDGASVYLDFGAGAASVGVPFEVLKPGDELKHPVTGASLGPVFEKAGAGKVVSVEEKYSVGTLEHGAAQAGWKARLGAAPGAPAPATASAAPTAGAAPGDGIRKPAVKSPFFPLEAVDVAVGDVDGDGEPDAVLATLERVEARRMSGDWGLLCAFDDKVTGSRILSAEARDLDGDGRAEVFLSVHARLASAVETHVLDCKDGVLKLRETLPWLVRSYADESGGRGLAAQALEPNASFPASSVHRLSHEGGKYVLVKPAFKNKRLEWLYGFGFAPSAGDPLLVYYNDAKKLVLRFKKGSWTTPAAYGYGSGHLQWHGTEFHFHPRLLTRVEGFELKSVYTLRNIPKLVSLSAAFGLYGGAELHRMAFNGISLEPVWKADLAGSAAGLDEVPAGPGRPRRLATAMVGANGLTAVWLFDE